MLKPLIWGVTLAGALLANVGFAHAKLVDSAPANGAKVAEPINALKLTFNEKVKLTALTIILADKPVPLSLDKSTPSAKTVLVPVSPLAPGNYELRWTAISTDDGHVTKGSFAFTVVGA